MAILSYSVLVIGIIVVVVAMYYTRDQFAGNKHLVDQFKAGGSPTKNSTGAPPQAQAPVQTSSTAGVK